MCIICYRLCGDNMVLGSCHRVPVLCRRADEVTTCMFGSTGCKNCKQKRPLSNAEGLAQRKSINCDTMFDGGSIKPTITRFTPCCMIAQLEDAGLNIMASIADVHRHVFNLFSPVIAQGCLLGNISRLPCDEAVMYLPGLYSCAS